jgi:hypothetical protein
MTAAERATWRKRALRGFLLLALVQGVAALIAELSRIRSASASPGPPPPAITSAPERTTPFTSASFAFADDQRDATFVCRLDGGAYSPCTSPKAYGALGDGKHAFDVEAVSGARTSAPASHAWTVDTVSPDAPSLVAGPAPATASSSAVFRFESSDPHGGFLCSLDGGPLRTCSSPLTLDGLAPGKHTFAVAAVDAAGNVGPATRTTWTVDRTPPPAPSIADGPAGTTTHTTATFSFTGAGAGVTFVCSLGGGRFEPCTSPAEAKGLAPGDHVFRVRAVDAAGNLGDPASLAWTVAVPVAPTAGGGGSTATPTTTSTTTAAPPGAAAPPSTTTTATATTTTTTTTTAVTPTGGPPPSLATTTTTPAAPPAPKKPAADTNPAPTPAISAHPPDPSPATDATFAFADAEAGVGFACKLDGGAFVDCASPKGYGGLHDGSHVFQVEAVDAAGNTSSARSYAWTVDTTPPAAPTITSGPPGPPAWTTTTVASLAFTAEAGATFLCSLDGASQTDFAPCTSPKAYPSVAQGPHTFRVEARDAAGNTSTAASRQWQVDSIPPAAPAFTLTPPDPSSSATSSFDWTPHLPAPDVDHFECARENGPWQPCTPPYSYPVDASNSGTHQFAVRAVDHAAHASGAARYSWKVTAGSGQDFTMDGDAVGLLYPGGPARPIAVTLHNPNDVPIQVTSLTVGVTDNPGGCLVAPIDMAVVQSNASAALPITIPANGSVTLPDPVHAPGVNGPTIRLLDTGADQTPNCANRTFHLSYTGSAHS